MLGHQDEVFCRGNTMPRSGFHCNCLEPELRQYSSLENMNWGKRALFVEQ